MNRVKERKGGWKESRHICQAPPNNHLPCLRTFSIPCTCARHIILFNSCNNPEIQALLLPFSDKETDFFLSV